MEIIIEIILEIIIEGVFVTATYKRVPLPLRILAGILAVGFFGGVIFLLIFTGLVSWKSSELRNGKYVAVLMFIGAVALFIGSIYKVVKFIRNKSD
ncbi:MAG: hypothetical protein K2N06_04255 [Oscillospiraceae bacterium]|nr:hypothetical protein [Oscillospiraceae bacterium]